MVFAGGFRRLQDLFGVRKDRYDPGRTVEFGRYVQEPGGPVTPLIWKVLDITNGTALLLADKCIDSKSYNDELIGGTWESCSLRRWLNDNFYNRAFNDDDRARIPRVRVRCTWNPEYDTDPGEDTYDFVFCPSYDEILKYFRKQASRKCRPTEYAAETGRLDVKGCAYWLRSPGSAPDSATVVGNDGSFHVVGVSRDDVAVRPALYVRLK